MITVDWCRMMAAYNAEMNRRFYAAAATLDDAARRLDRGAFFGSIHATLSHLVWADTMWMSRLAGWPKPAAGIPGSIAMAEAFPPLRAMRVEIDQGMEGWIAGLAPEALEGNLTWFSGSTRSEQVKPRAVVLTHLFNHQTHHRGQVHAMLTAAGARTGDTDLPFVL